LKKIQNTGEKRRKTGEGTDRKDVLGARQVLGSQFTPSKKKTGWGKRRGREGTRYLARSEQRVLLKKNVGLERNRAKKQREEPGLGDYQPFPKVKTLG